MDFRNQVGKENEAKIDPKRHPKLCDKMDMKMPKKTRQEPTTAFCGGGPDPWGGRYPFMPGQPLPHPRQPGCQAGSAEPPNQDPPRQWPGSAVAASQDQAKQPPGSSQALPGASPSGQRG